MNRDKNEKGPLVRRRDAQRRRFSENRSTYGISSSDDPSLSIQPEKISLAQMLEALKLHDHLCLIYESAEEWRAAAVPFMAIGLRHGEKCIYIVDTSTVDEIRKYLAEEGIDVASAEKSGQLSVLHETEAYTKDGSFDPDSMIALLISETEKAIAEGYSALRATGEMTWVLRGHPGSEKLLEYEAKLNSYFFPKYPCLAICQYDRWKFDPEIIKGVVMTHPLLIKGNKVYHNFYYIPPEEFLNRKRAELEVQHWLNNLERERRIRESLSFERAQLLSILDSIEAVAYVADLGTYEVLYVNNFIKRLLGKDPTGSKCYKEFQGFDRPCDFCTNDIILKEKTKTYQWEHHNPKVNRDYALFDRIIRWPDGRDVRFELGIDITERKQAEEALRQSEERYRTILDEMEESYYEVDLAGNFTFVNDALCHRLGYPRDKLLGMNYRAYTPDEARETAFKIFNQVYRTGQPVKGVPTVAIARDGSLIYTERSIFPLKDQKGEIIGFRGISRDITERKKIEEERRQLEIKAQITSRLASVGEMVAGIAHEINNPLTGITGYAQLLMDRKDIPPDIRADLEAINDGAQRVAGIVQRLLAFSRQTKPERKLVDINTLIESTLALRAYHLRMNSIKVTTNLAADLPETVVDPGQIQQVLLNLIVNAETEMKLAHGKGKLTITTEKAGDNIKISVKDNGPGIKPEVMDRMFDPFFTTREPGQGTGLGLSLCHGIVAEHNGRIYAESKPRKGATFIMELPVVSGVTAPEPPEATVKKSKRKVKGRILVVDDEQVVRDVATRILTAEGHHVETVDNAAEALKKIKGQKYDLILLDIKMPCMSGVTLYKRIQKTDKSLANRVVFITGDVMGADTEKFLAENKVAHIEKPFDAERLSREVQRALSRLE